MQTPLPSPPPPLEPRMPASRCWLCGQTPARSITVARNTGMIIMRRWEYMQPAMCRSHGVRLSAQWLGYTLVLGWWGVISFFVNFGAIAIDLFALGRALFTPRPD